MGQYLPIDVGCTSHFLYGKLFGGGPCREVVKLCYVSGNEGVSC